LQKLSFTDLPKAKRILCIMQQDAGSVSYAGALITNYECVHTFLPALLSSFQDRSFGV
jgi:hypothetical protein